MSGVNLTKSEQNEYSDHQLTEIICYYSVRPLYCQIKFYRDHTLDQTSIKLKLIIYDFVWNYVLKFE